MQLTRPECPSSTPCPLILLRTARTYNTHSRMRNPNGPTTRPDSPSFPVLPCPSLSSSVHSRRPERAGSQQPVLFGARPDDDVYDLGVRDGLGDEVTAPSRSCPRTALPHLLGRITKSMSYHHLITALMDSHRSPAPVDCERPCATTPIWTTVEGVSSEDDMLWQEAHDASGVKWIALVMRLRSTCSTRNLSRYSTCEGGARGGTSHRTGAGSSTMLWLPTDAFALQHVKVISSCRSLRFSSSSGERQRSARTARSIVNDA